MKKIRIVTTSMATLEDVNPPFNLRHPSPTANAGLAEDLLRTAAAYQPDLVLLPEVFLMAGHAFSKVRDMAEPVPGPGFDLLAAHARAGDMNIVAGHMVAENESYYNRGLVIDRQGERVGAYTKNHPTEGEINNGVTPGSDAPTFDLDFGRIGVAICFDINWPGLWQTYAEKKVDLVAWLSAYEGGFPLQSYAWQHKMPIVSSVWPYHSRVIDITGQVLAETSRWDRLAVVDLNLDRGLFHTDDQMEKIRLIREKYGEAVTLKAFTELHLFLLESESEDLSIEALIEEFDLTTYPDYIDRCTRAQQAARE